MKIIQRRNGLPPPQTVGNARRAVQQSLLVGNLQDQDPAVAEPVPDLPDGLDRSRRCSRTSNIVTTSYTSPSPDQLSMLASITFKPKTSRAYRAAVGETSIPPSPPALFPDHVQERAAPASHVQEVRRASHAHGDPVELSLELARLGAPRTHPGTAGNTTPFPPRHHIAHRTRGSLPRREQAKTGPGNSPGIAQFDRSPRAVLPAHTRPDLVRPAEVTPGTCLAHH